MRIEQHPILEFKRGEQIKFYFNGKEMIGFKGDTIASALYALGIYKLSESKKSQRPRGIFCAVGHCSSCLMTVDGIPNVRTCVIPLKEGMKIESQSQEVVTND